MKLKTKFDAAWAYPTKLFVINVGEWRYMRPVVKVAKCCRCEFCSLYCPTGCIEEKGNHFEANLLQCKGCGICARTCPIHAIKMVMEG
jgi:2-oxoacid:acceptor oxidoreductase delta subunit (pyruvate/2-ketoisovalerate family)